jgi:hypothetical protein
VLRRLVKVSPENSPAERVKNFTQFPPFLPNAFQLTDVFVKKKSRVKREILNKSRIWVSTAVVSALPEKQPFAFVAYPIAGPMIQKRPDPFRRAGAFQFELNN